MGRHSADWANVGSAKKRLTRKNRVAACQLCKRFQRDWDAIVFNTFWCGQDTSTGCTAAPKVPQRPGGNQITDGQKKTAGRSMSYRPDCNPTFDYCAGFFAAFFFMPPDFFVVAFTTVVFASLKVAPAGTR